MGVKTFQSYTFSSYNTSQETVTRFSSLSSKTIILAHFFCHRPTPGGTFNYIQFPLEDYSRNFRTQNPKVLFVNESIKMKMCIIFLLVHIPEIFLLITFCGQNMMTWIVEFTGFYMSKNSWTFEILNPVQNAFLLIFLDLLQLSSLRSQL